MIRTRRCSILAGGLMLAAVTIALRGYAQDAPKPNGVKPAEKPRKFSTPVTAPGAEWHRDGVWAGSGVSGYLDGPRMEVFVFSGPSRGGVVRVGRRLQSTPV